MPRKRAESTFYLGEQLHSALQSYRSRLPGPPTASSLVREAVRRFLNESSMSGKLPPAVWVEQTEPMMREQRRQGVDVHTDQILDILDQADAEATRSVLGLDE